MKILVLLFPFFIHTYSFAQSSSEILLKGDIKLSDFIAENLQLPARAEFENQFDTVKVTVYGLSNSPAVIAAINGYRHWDFAAEVLLLFKNMPVILKKGGYVTFDVPFTKDTKKQEHLASKDYKKFQKAFVPYENDPYLNYYQSLFGKTLSEYYIPYCLEQNFKLHPDQAAVRVLARCVEGSRPSEFRSFEMEENECSKMLLKAYQLSPALDADPLLTHKDVILLWRRRSGNSWGDFRWVLSFAIPQQYKGGVEAMNEFIHENLLYPVTAFEAKKEGECVIGFCCVSSGGTNIRPCIRVISSDDHDFLMESLRCLSKMDNFDLSIIPSFKHTENHESVAQTRDEEKVLVLPEMIIHFKFDLENTKRLALTKSASREGSIQPFLGNVNAQKPCLISQKENFDRVMIDWYFSNERIQKLYPQLLDSTFNLNMYGVIDKFGYFHLDESQTENPTKEHPGFTGFVKLIEALEPWMPAEVDDEVRSHSVWFRFQSNENSKLSALMEYPSSGYGTITPRFIGNKEEMTRYLVSGLSVACNSGEIAEDSILVKFHIDGNRATGKLETQIESDMVFQDGFREFQYVWTGKQINGRAVPYDTAMYIHLETDKIVYRNNPGFCPPKGKKYTTYDEIHGNVVIPPQYFGGKIGLDRHIQNNLNWTKNEKTKYDVLKNLSRKFRITFIVDKNGNTDSVEVTIIAKSALDAVGLYDTELWRGDNGPLKEEFENVLTEKVRAIFLKLGKWIPGRSKDSDGMPVHTMMEFEIITPEIIQVEKPKWYSKTSLVIKKHLTKPKPFIILDYPSNSDPYSDPSYYYKSVGDLTYVDVKYAGMSSTFDNYICETPASFGNDADDLSNYLNGSIQDFIRKNPNAELEPFRMDIRIDENGQTYLKSVRELLTLLHLVKDNRQLAESIVEKMPLWKPAVKDGKAVAVRLYLVIEP